MLNRAELIGRLGGDPEIRVTESGTQIANMNLATSKKYKSKDGQVVEDTQWHRIVCFNQLAELCEKYLKKGSLIYIDGEIKNRSYDDKDGIKRYITEIFARTMRFLDTKREDSGPQKAQQQESVPHDENNIADDLPF